MRYIRIIFIDLLIVSLFCLLSIVIMRALLAEVSFGEAQKLVAEYKWTRATPEFEEAIRLDPFNARYYAGLGNFLLKQSRHRDHRKLLLDRAEALYREAVRLNPGEGMYWVRLGQMTAGSDTKEGFVYFRKAVANDPNGFNVNYEVGYAGVAVWKYLNADERDFILAGLKRALEAKPWYAKDIYIRLWKASGDFEALKRATPGNLKANTALYNFLISQSLWQFIPEARKAVRYYREKDDPQRFKKETALRRERFERIKRLAIVNSGWAGDTPDGKHTFKDGNMYWNGTVDRPVELPEGVSAIKIEASGTPAGGVYPYMAVELDAEEIGGAYVDSVEWREYEFDIKMGPEIRVLSVTFVNDGGNRAKKEDRNLFVGEVTTR